ncbi:MAG: periplasmic heavy metal sensor [Hyphomicrobiaceae bacterium]
MTHTGPSSAAPRWPRWKGVLLVASLAVNLLIFGIVSAAGIKHGWGPPPSVQQATLLRFARGLPAERKKQVWDVIRPQIRAIRPFWRELREARAVARAALTAEPFDVQRFRTAHARMLEAELNVRKAIYPLYDNVGTLLTPEERREYARWQSEHERPWRNRHHRTSGDRQGDDADDDPPQKSQAAPASVTPTPSSKP